MTIGSAPKHTFLLDRMKGRYVDVGPATRFDKIASYFSAGQIRIAEPKPSTQPAGNPFETDKFEA